MKNTLLVLKNEIISVVFRRSFILMLFLLPLISFVVFYFVSSANGGDSEQNLVSEIFAAPEEPAVEGLLDESGVIKEIPQDLKEGFLVVKNMDEMEAALSEGVISSYYVIPQDYLESGEVFYYRADFNPVSGMENSETIEYTLNYNLLGQDEKKTLFYQSPYDLEVSVLSEAPARDPGNALTFFLPYVVTFLFYIVIFGSASMMLNSITNEKQNRVIEILMTSVTPAQMLTGKIIALGIVGLLQTLVWSGTGFVLLRLSGRTFEIPAAFQLDPVFLLWGLAFFVAGYAVYASLMAGVGALVPNIKEASQATFVLIIPLIIPLMLISALIQKPNGGLSVFLSLFPLTSPVTMMTRLSATVVPLWQTLLALALLVGTAFLVMRSVSGMFRAQNLLSGQPFKLKIFFKALFGRI